MPYAPLQAKSPGWIISLRRHQDIPAKGEIFNYLGDEVQPGRPKKSGGFEQKTLGFEFFCQKSKNGL